jgi:hypothetical protein
MSREGTYARRGIADIKESRHSGYAMGKFIRGVYFMGGLGLSDCREGQG